VLVLRQHAELPAALPRNWGIPWDTAAFGNRAHWLCGFVGTGWKKDGDERKQEEAFHFLQLGIGLL